MNLVKTFTQNLGDVVINTYSTNFAINGSVVTQVTTTTEIDDELTYTSVAVKHTNNTVNLIGNFILRDELEDALDMDLLFTQEQDGGPGVCTLIKK